MQEQEQFSGEQQVVNAVSFNEDCSCVALATTRGFKIFTLHPLLLRQQRDLSAPLQIVQMMDRTNILLLVGFQDTLFKGNQLAFYDDSANEVVTAITYPSNILTVKSRLRKALVAILQRIYLVNSLTMETQLILPTIAVNELERYELASLSGTLDNLLLAVAAQEKGRVTLAYVQRGMERTVLAHKSMLNYVLLSADGCKLATCSEQGMVVRIFDTLSGALLQELRRGNEYSFVYSLAFSIDGNWLACTSDSCNVHVFAVLPSTAAPAHYPPTVCKTNPKSWLYCLRKALPMFHAEYSYAHYVIDNYEPEMQTFVEFTPQSDSIYVINDYGEYTKAVISEKGGNCIATQKNIELLKINTLSFL